MGWIVSQWSLSNVRTAQDWILVQQVIQLDKNEKEGSASQESNELKLFSKLKKE